MERRTDVGAYSAVVGTAITRPMEITRKFINTIKSGVIKFFISDECGNIANFKELDSEAKMRAKHYKVKELIIESYSGVEIVRASLVTKQGY